MAPSLDLKSSLTLRVVAVALFCFVIAAAFALFGTYRDVRQLNEHVADVLVRQLQIQLETWRPASPTWMRSVKPSRVRANARNTLTRTAASHDQAVLVSIATLASRRIGLAPFAI